MRLVTLDFESTYDKEYSLKKLTTEEYIRDPRFEVIGVGVKIDKGPSRWVTGAKIAPLLNALRLEECAVLAHNMAFDGAILSWRYGINPKLLLDTLSMARPHNAMTTGVSLAALSAFYNLGEKGFEVHDAIGKRLADFTTEELDAYGRYCCNDVDLTYALFQKLVKLTPKRELSVIDQTLRMFTQPKIVLDASRLEAFRDAQRENKKRLLLEAVGTTLGVGFVTEDEAKKVLMSNNKFAELLTKLGVDPPMKTSKTTGNPTYAFAKNDKEFLALQDSDNPAVQAVVAARLGVKSTIDETRAESLLKVSARGRLPVLLNYWGAHTGRFSGGGGLNLQNLRRGGELRKSLVAPDGYTFVAADLSQIEARMLAYVAGQYDLVEAFAKGRDVYSEFASDIYQRPITKADKVERFIGKSCLSGDTLVLTRAGWKQLKDIAAHDKLWDGDAWVSHCGLINNGTRETLNLSGVWLTPDHRCWSGGTWVRADEMHAHRMLFTQGLDYAKEHLPSQVTYSDVQVGRAGSWYDVFAARTSSMLHTAQHGGSLPSDAQCAQSGQQTETCSATLTLSRIAGTGFDWSTAWRQPLIAATIRRALRIPTMVAEAYRSMLHGVRTALASSDMLSICPDGTIRRSNWIVRTLTDTTRRATYASLPGERTTITDAQSVHSRKNLTVYDIANVGPKNRFTVLTADGPLLVHNCIAEGTLVLTQRGEIPIEEITKQDRVWDGTEWVSHGGVVFNGIKEVISYGGIEATEDHGVFTERGYMPFGIAAAQTETLVRTGVAGEAVRVSENKLYGIATPWEAHMRIDHMHKMWRSEVDKQKQSNEWEDCRLPVVHANEIRTQRNSRAEVRCNSGAVSQPEEPGVQTLWRSRRTLPVQITDGVHLVGGREPAAPHIRGGRNRPRGQRRPLRTGQPTAGEQTGANSEQAEHCARGVARKESAAVGFPVPVYAKLDVQVGSAERTYGRANTRKVRVYDIINAGPRARYTAGGCLVFNCILGLGYGMSSNRFFDFVSLGAGGIKIEMDPYEAARIVRLYRSKYVAIATLWRTADTALRAMSNGRPYYLTDDILFENDQIRLPDGSRINYPLFKSIRHAGGYSLGYVNSPLQYKRAGYDALTGERTAQYTYVHGAKTVENIIQAMARGVICEHMVEVGKRYPVVLQVHDEIVILVPDEADAVLEAKGFMQDTLSRAPAWCKGVPVACEVSEGRTYGDTK